MCSRRVCGACALLGCLAPFLAVLLPAFFQLTLHGYVDRSFLPWDLPNLLLTKGKYQTRTLGMTPAGNPDAYAAVRLSEEEKAQYFREGYVVIRNAIDPAILDSIRAALWEEIGPASWPWAHNSFMAVDSVLDFYLFSSLPSMAAQIFGSSESDIVGQRLEGEQVPTHLWSDFHYFRPARGVSVIEYHTDSQECEGFLPANHTTTSRLRFWVTLDDDVLAPPMINQSFFLSHLNATQLEYFWAGKGRGIEATAAVDWLRLSGQFPDTSNPAIWTKLPHLSRGDLLIHSPCLIHSSPPPMGRSVAFLCPTYAPGESRIFQEGNAGAPGRSCARRVPINRTIAGSGTPCLPQVYPRDAAFKKGAKVQFEGSDYDPVEAVRSWVWWRMWRFRSSRNPDPRQPRISGHDDL